MKPRGRLTAHELIARVGESLLDAPAGSLKFVKHRVPLSGSRGLGRRGWSGQSDAETEGREEAEAATSAAATDDHDAANRDERRS